MNTGAIVEINEADQYCLRPGDTIGRGRQSRLRINHPAISEAHALVSLRGSSLRLLALRGRFSSGLRVLTDVVLEPGLRLTLPGETELLVTSVTLPSNVLAIDIPGTGCVIPPPVASILADSPNLVPGYSARARAVLWVDDHQLHMLRPGASAVQLGEGDSFQVDTLVYRIVSVPLNVAAFRTTAVDGGLRAGLVFFLRYDSVHILDAATTHVVSGVPARILTELGLMRVPVEWTVVAATLWPGESDKVRLRMKWDAGLARIRRALREFGLPTDIVHTDGAGRAELVLRPGDRIVDET